MPVDIVVPPLSQTMDTLILVAWLKNIGDPVTKGETLFTVETDKATLEVESPATGVLASVTAAPGEEISVRAIIGTILESGESLDAADPHEPPSAALRTPSPVSAQSEDPSSLKLVEGTIPEGEDLPPERLKRIFASPRARKLAEERGISLEALRGSGTGPQELIIAKDVEAYTGHEKVPHKITPLAKRMAEKNGIEVQQLTSAETGSVIKKADVQAALTQRGEPPAGSNETPASAGVGTSHDSGEIITVQLSPTRMTIARRMHASHLNTAPVTYMTEVDATRLVKLRKRILKNLPAGAPRPTYTDLLMMIVCFALADHPELNATFDGEAYEISSRIHLALAVDTMRGLIAPVMRDAGRKNLAEVIRLRQEMVERAMAGTVRLEELSGGTFTLTNLGVMGVDHFTPILNPPQVAILGIGRIRKVAAIHKGRIRKRRIMGLALTCDHRVIDGGPAARFLSDLSAYIENPDKIWLDSLFGD